MKTMFCASILFPYTFWILMHLIPLPPKATCKEIDLKSIGQCQYLMKSNYNCLIESISIKINTNFHQLHPCSVESINNCSFQIQ